MEVINELFLLYKKARDSIQYTEKQRNWDKIEYKFEDDPPCIKALLENGVFELGSINMTQMRLAAYLKIRDIPLVAAIQILDEWVMLINPSFIQEIHHDGVVDYTYLKEQNRYIARTVFSAAHYGFSCAGIKQIPGVAEFCQQWCRNEVSIGINVTLFNATRAEYKNKRMDIVAECIGRQDNVMIIPKTVTVECVAIRHTETKCGDCTLFGTDGSPLEFSVDASSKHILSFLEQTRTPLSGKIAAMIGKPRKQCSLWKYHMTEQNAELVYVVPPVANEYSDADRHTRQAAFYIGHGLQTNQAFKFSGYGHTSEFSNHVRLVFDKAEEVADSLTNFEQTPKMRSESRIFEVGKSTVLNKYSDIIDSLTYNHIKIWGREDMIMALDLAFHSVKRFKFQRKIIKGWMNILVIGDSGQGKSLAAEALMQHYNLGYKASAESSTRSGLMYGIDTKGEGPNSLIWGAIPRQSGRLVVIDELKELINSGHFAQLTEARSSGMVKVDTIVSGRAMAETRLILLTNPPAKRTMGSYICPVESIQDLIPDLEDTRRFDLVVGVASKEVLDETIHQDIESMDEIPDTYTGDKCKHHLLWVWNLQPNDIIIPHTVEIAILRQSLSMCEIYSSIIPIVEPADQRESLARVSAAIAARVNSVDGSGKLVVTEDHVDAAYEFMLRLYNGPGLRYDVFSSNNARYILSEKSMGDLLVKFRNSEEWSTSWKRIIQYISEEGYIHARPMASVLNFDVADAARVLDWFSSYKMMRMLSGNRYVKSENGVAFVLFVKKTIMEEDKKVKKIEGGEEF